MHKLWSFIVTNEIYVIESPVASQHYGTERSEGALNWDHIILKDVSISDSRLSFP